MRSVGGFLDLKAPAIVYVRIAKRKKLLLLVLYVALIAEEFFGFPNIVRPLFAVLNAQKGSGMRGTD